MDQALLQALMPLAICVARVADVSLGTMRTVAVVRGRVALASGLGFVEICIWVVAISKVMTSLDNPWNVLGYAAGFSLGNAAGIVVERKLAFGRLVVRVFSRDKGPVLANALRRVGLRVTEFDGRGRDGSVKLLYLMMERVDADAVERIVDRLDPAAFVVVEDLRSANRHLFPATVSLSRWRLALAKK